MKCRALVFTVKLNGDNSILVSGDVTGHCTLWNTADGTKLREWHCGSQVRSVDIADNLVATGCKDGDVCTWDALTGMCIRKIQASTGMIYSVDLSSDASLIATGDQLKQAVIWDLASGGMFQRMTCSEVVKRVDLSADVTVLATGAGNDTALWDVASGALIESKELGGRIKLRGDKDLMVSVNAVGKATVRRLLSTGVPAVWMAMAKDPMALAAAACCVPSYELLMVAQGPSGRTLVAHAAAHSNIQ
eukprot:3982340-Prymnesium_polylepis.1